jgi:chromosome segregation ATPase
MSKLIDPTRDIHTLSDSIDVVKKTAISLSNQQATLTAVVRDLVAPITEASNGLSTFGKSLDSSVDKLLPAAERVADTMSSIRETTGVIDKAYEKLFSVSDRLENVAAYLVSDAFRASSQVIGEMTVGQNQFLSKMDKSLDDQIQLIQQSIGQQQALQSNFMQLIAAYESMQRDQMPAVSELKNAVQTQSALSTKLADQASTIADSTRKLSETIDQGNTKLKEAMSTTNSTMATMINALNAMLERFNSIPFWPNWPGSKSGNGRGR